jgi:hypothetical protein
MFRQDPFVVMHGINSYAQDMLPWKNLFEQRGYKSGSIFATT